MSSFRVVYDHALTLFADVSWANRYRVRRLWLISPWIKGDEGKYDFVSQLGEVSKIAQAGTFVLTRPSKEAWHKNALRVLGAAGRTIVLHNDRLHTKLYLLECDGFRYAMLGSPNLTTRGDRGNVELAMEFRTTMSTSHDNVALVLNDLVQYAGDLCNDPDAALVNAADL